VDSPRISSTVARLAVAIVVIAGSIGVAVPLAAAGSSREARAHASVVTDRDVPLELAFATQSFEAELIVTPRNGGALAVYPTPDAAVPVQTLPAYDELGSPLTLLSLTEQAGWLEVLLPTRPNGATAWVRLTDVNTTSPTYEVVVSRSAHELRLIRRADDAVVMTSEVGVGSPSRPTPAGRFFVRDHFPTGQMNHPYGPFAFGLSGHSDVLSRFGTGDGRIAIHGTNQPSSIGADVSNGCVHVPNDVVLALIPYLPLGTPVTIT
jgi:lipoprotein-anchoring transpeptidase ErfK/SrfK